MKNFVLKPAHSDAVWMVLMSALLGMPPAFAAEPPKEVAATSTMLKFLKIETVKTHEIQDSLRLSARVELDQQRVTRIGSAVTGRVTEIHAMLGETVKKGQRLATLNSTELSRAQSDYLKAGSQVNLRRLAVNRAERLLQSDVIAAAELQERQGVLHEAEVDLRAATDQLRVMGMSDADLKRLEKQRTIFSFSPVTASIDGVVIDRNVALGQVVQPADMLYIVADLSRVWIVAEVPEQQVHWVKKGDHARVEISALPDLDVTGEIIYVADMVNPETRTVTLRMTLPNPKRLFKPHMLATLNITKHGAETLAIPNQAIVRDDDQDHVFVEISPNRFELRRVQLGAEEHGLRPLLDGIKTGDRIVTQGAFHLNNERMRVGQE